MYGLFVQEESGTKRTVICPRLDLFWACSEQMVRAGTQHTKTTDKTARKKPTTVQTSPSTDMRKQKLEGKGNGARFKSHLLSGKEKK